MSGRKEWRGITRASMLIGSLSAAAFVFNATATTAAQPSRSPALQVGQPAHKTIIKLAPAVVRGPRDAAAYQAAHPSLDLRRQTHPVGIPMGRAAYEAAKARAASAPFVAKPTPYGANVPPPVAPTRKVLAAAGPSEADTGDGFAPPDSNGAIGGSQLVAPVNLSYNVYDRKGVLKLHETFGAFLGTAVNLSDPRVVYDPLWKRWVVSIIEIPATATSQGRCFWLAISKTADATGQFYVYRACVSSNDGSLWDYDMLGMNQDAVILTGNWFDSSEVYQGAIMAAFAKARLYNGLGFSVPVFNVGTAGTLAPPIVQDQNPNAFFLVANSDGAHLNLYKGTDLGNAFYATLTLQSQLTFSGTHTIPPNAPQPGTSDLLDTLDGRFQAPSAQYGNTLWNIHAIGLGSFPAPHFYQIDTSANTITQEGTFYESSSSYDFNPSIAANSNDEAIVTWSTTDIGSTTKHNAWVRYSGRQSGDAAGVIGVGSVLVKSSLHLTGNGGSVQRWGDYSSVFLDSSAPSACSGASNRRAAIFNEKIINANTWGVELGIVGFC